MPKRTHQLPIDPTSVEAIASRLRATRLTLGLNQSQFGQRAGIERNTYNQYESGQRRISLDMALSLCDAFRLTLDWIYRGDPAGLPHELARRAVEVSQSASSKSAH